MVICSTIDTAMLEYVIENGVMDMYHTEVPPSYQGRGLAGLLAKVFVSYILFFLLFFKFLITTVLLIDLIPNVTFEFIFNINEHKARNARRKIVIISQLFYFLPTGCL